MHELSIVEALIDQVNSEVDRAAPGGRVTRLDLVVGKLSGVNTDSIRFAFEMLSPDTAMEGARLEIAEVKPLCCCRQCNARVQIDEFVVTCPQCGSGDIYMEGGQDLLLQSIEVEQ